MVMKMYMHFLLTKKIKIKLNLAVLGYFLEFKKKCFVVKNNIELNPETFQFDFQAPV